MNNEEILLHLNKFHKKSSLLELSDFDGDERNILPKSWLIILSKSGKERVSLMLESWDKFKCEYKEVTELLNENLLSVNLFNSYYGYGLLYEIKSIDGLKTIFYEAQNPKQKVESESLAKKWKLLPNSIRSFYEFNNGFTRLGTGAYGPTPRENMSFISDDYWQIIEDMGSHSFDLDNILTVYSNAGGGYLCVDLSQEEHSYSIWWVDEEPDVNVDFWPVLDTWTLFGME